MNRITKTLLTSAAALALLSTAVVPADAGPLTPNGARFAAVGDSYAAGLGNTPLKHAGLSYRSAAAYPVLLAGAANKVNFLAESGATITTVLANQVRRVLPATQQITVTVGGNDVGFADVAMACAGTGVGCAAAVGRASEALNILPQNLGSLITHLRTRAPQATIYVTGYPMLFQPTAGTCPGLPGYSPATMALFDGATLQLNGIIQATATQLGAVYVDVVPEFEQHGLCDGADSFIFPPSFLAPGVPDPSSLHPTANGQAAYARVVEASTFHSADEG
ncbi:MAG: SGNH/GDSL hydrolase family protein [Arachnia sp.]